MAVSTVREIPGTEFTVDSKGEKTVVRKWLITTGINDTEAVASGGIPVFRGDPYFPDVSLNMFAKTSKTTRVDGQLGIFVGEVTYSNQWDETGQGSQDTSDLPTKDDLSTDPTVRPWTIKFSSVVIEEVIEEDFSTVPKPVVNSVWEKFDPPVTVANRHTIISIEAFKPITFNPQAMKSLFDNTVNDGLFLGYPVKTLRVNEYNWTSVYESGAWFWKVELVLEVNWNKWCPTRILNVGRWAQRAKYDPVTHITTTYWQVITDSNGQPMSLPLHVNPDANGEILPIDPDNPLDDLEYLEFNFYNVVNWTGALGDPAIL